MIYKTLFNINLHHPYHLDSGEKKYNPSGGDTPIEAEERNTITQAYNLQSFINIVPASNVKLFLKNHRMLWRMHKEGFRVLMNTQEVTVSSNTKYQPIIKLSEDFQITFAIYSSDPLFDNYTQKTSTSNSRLYLFSNTVNSLDTPVDNIFDGDGKVDASYLMTAKDTRDIVQLLSEHENKSDNPIITKWVFQAITEIQKNDLLTENQKNTEIKTLLNNFIQSEKKKGLVGFIQLSVMGDNSNNLLEIDGSNQYALAPEAAFNLEFKNRKTFWRYIHRADEITLTTTAKKPLTKNGFVTIDETDFDPQPTEDYQYPNPSAALIKKESNNYYSEIFI